MNASLPIVIVTYHDLFQWLSKADGLKAKYKEYSAMVQMSPWYLEVLGIEDGATVKLWNATGVIVVRARLENSCPQGFGYMLVSPYSNRLINYTSSKTRLPNFKRIEVQVEPCNEDVTPISDLGDFLI